MTDPLQHRAYAFRPPLLSTSITANAAIGLGRCADVGRLDVKCVGAKCIEYNSTTTTRASTEEAAVKLCQGTSRGFVLNVKSANVSHIGFRQVVALVRRPSCGGAFSTTITFSAHQELIEVVSLG